MTSPAARPPRLGELLVAEGVVLPAHVERARAIQSRRAQRLGAILVDAGLATADAVARALARQHGVPAALERHLAGRDATLAKAVPADLARARQLLPLARTRDGRLVIAMRDPGDAALRAMVERVTGGPIIAAAVCEVVLARHVDGAYPELGDGVDVDVDLESQPIPIVTDEPPAHDELELDVADLDLGPPLDILDPATVRAGPIDETFELLDPDSLGSALVDLDHAAVARTPHPSDPQLRRPPGVSGRFPAPAARPPPPGAVAPALAPAALAGSGAVAPAPPSIPPATLAPTAPTPPLARIAAAPDADAVAAAVIDYGRAAGCLATVILAVRHGMAFGDAGYAPALSGEAIEAITVPLSVPSVIKTTVDTARLYAGRAPVGGAIQDRLMKLLGRPGGVVAAPIVAGGRVASVIVATFAAEDDARARGPELADLASAAAAAATRLR